jgi:hypothetical protein
MSNSLKPVAIRLVKGSLIGLSVVAGLTIIVLTVLTAAFSITAEKSLELSQDFEWEEIPATILDSRVLAPVDGGELGYCEEIPDSLFCEEAGTSYQTEQPDLAPREEFQEAMDEALEIDPEPAPKALVIPANASKSWLQGMCIHRCIEYPKQATKPQLITLLKAHQANA